MVTLGYVALAVTAFLGAMAVAYFLAGLVHIIDRPVAWGKKGLFELITAAVLAGVALLAWFLHRDDNLRPLLLTSGIASVAGLLWAIVVIATSR
jgi:hypothetical protein